MECNYSFEMLYKAAFGKNISKKQKQSLQKLSQDKINAIVKIWAKKANWIVAPKIGSDDLVYISFRPKLQKC